MWILLDRLWVNVVILVVMYGFMLPVYGTEHWLLSAVLTVGGWFVGFLIGRQPWRRKHEF